MYRTVEEMKTANTRIGLNWFSFSRNRGSSVASEVIDGRFYIEKCLLIPGDPRSVVVHRVVECNERGEIDYTDPSATFDTAAQARNSLIR